MKSLSYLVACFGVISIAGLSQAVTFSWSGLSNDTGNMLGASADFTAVGNVLTIVLTNTSTGPSTSPADTLGTLVWDMSNAVTQPDGGNDVDQGASSVMQNNAIYGSAYDLDKEWMYEDAFTFLGIGFGHGVSSVGLGVFGTNEDTFYERMKGSGAAGSSMADRFSISSAAGTTGAANNFPVVQNSITFTLVSDTAIELNSIGNVGFSFGSGAQTSSVPEPATMTLLALGAAAIIKRRKR